MKLSFKKWLEITRLRLTKNRKKRLNKKRAGSSLDNDSPEWTAGWNTYTERKKR